MRLPTDGGLPRLAPISRAVVTNYHGSEIPDWEALGLDPQWVYRIYRDPIELARGAASFAGRQSSRSASKLPRPLPELIIGEVGRSVEMLFTTLVAPIWIWDLESVAAIESGERRCLSASYHYDYIFEEGVAPDGRAYDKRAHGGHCRPPPSPLSLMGGFGAHASPHD